MNGEKVIPYSLTDNNKHAHYFINGTIYICNASLNAPSVYIPNTRYVPASDYSFEPLINKWCRKITRYSPASDYSFEHLINNWCRKIVVCDGVTDIFVAECSQYISVREVVLSKSVTNIDNNAFSSCPIETFTIHENVKHLGYGSLANTEEVTFETVLPGVMWGAITHAGYGLPWTTKPLIWHTAGGKTIHLPRVFNTIIHHDKSDGGVTYGAQFKAIMESPKYECISYEDILSFNDFFRLLGEELPWSDGHVIVTSIFTTIAELAIEIDTLFPSILKRTNVIGRVLELGMKMLLLPDDVVSIDECDTLWGMNRLDKLIAIANSQLAKELVWTNQYHCMKLLEEANEHNIPQFAAVVLDKGHKYGGLNTDATDFEL